MKAAAIHDCKGDVRHSDSRELSGPLLAGYCNTPIVESSWQLQYNPYFEFPDR